jgi:PPOX class probable F420-dependent enzyme
MASIPESVLDLFEKPVLANLATVMPDGTPQVTPIWVDFDGTHLLFNTVKGRQKALNMDRNEKVGVDMVASDNAWHWLSVRGRVVEVTEEGADAHIDKMMKKYTGQDKYAFAQPGEVRVIYKVLPLKVVVS